MDTMENFVNDTYNSNVMKDDGYYDDFLSDILFKYEPLETISLLLSICIVATVHAFVFLWQDNLHFVSMRISLWRNQLWFIRELLQIAINMQE